MKKLKNFVLRLWKDESAQGTAEYILLLVAIVTIAFIFKDRIKELVTGKMGQVSDSLGDFNVDR